MDTDENRSGRNTPDADGHRAGILPALSRARAMRKVKTAHSTTAGRVLTLPPECARPRAQQPTTGEGSGLFSTPLLLADAAAPEDGRTPAPVRTVVAVSRCTARLQNQT